MTYAIRLIKVDLKNYHFKKSDLLCGFIKAYSNQDLTRLSYANENNYANTPSTRSIRYSLTALNSGSIKRRSGQIKYSG